MQYYHITMILLALGDSQRLKIGIGQKKSHKLLQQEVAYHASLLFGICTTGDGVEVRLMATNAVSVCAPWITDRAQQEGLITILGRIERENAWPSRIIAFGAMDEWGWGQEERSLFEG